MRLALGLSGMLVATLVAACSDDNKDAFGGAVVYDDFPATSAGADRSDDLGVAHAFVLKAAFRDGVGVQYADLGDVNPTPPSIYLLVKGGTPVAGQYPIIDTLPDKPDYGTFWQVVEVTVPSSYKANDLKSLAGLKDAGYKMTPKLEAVHCAVVNPDATWFTADLAGTINVFWGDGELQPNPYFDPSAEPGPTNPIVVDETGAKDGDIVLQPVWQKRHRAFCYTEGFDQRTPLTADADGVVSFDTTNLAARYDAGAYPVFEATPAASKAPALFVGNDAGSTVAGQPGSPADIDVATAEPYGLVDNPILGEVALDRYEVVITNTTPAPPDSKSERFGPGAMIVSDDALYDADGDGTADSAYLFAEGLAVAPEVAALIGEGDTVPLATAYSGDPLLGPVADYQTLAPLAPQASYTTIVVTAPYFPALTVFYSLPDEADSLAGATTALYDGDGAPLATQSANLELYGAGLTTEDGIVEAADPAVILGTVTFTHLAH
ncbi:MAG: hypothetical protein U1F43_12235 [Myxococcota bacterium]